MNTKFIVNDYAIIWNLLFQASISESIYKLKQKLWDTYKVEYNETYKDKEAILKDIKNFIPNNDTIYNFLLANKNYERIRKQVEKYRLDIMKLWDKNKRMTNLLIKNVIRKELPDYTFFVVNKELNILDHSVTGSMIIGKEIDSKNQLSILYEILMHIVMDNIKYYEAEDKRIKRAIVELAVLNEYPTMIDKKSHYLSGNPELLSMKRWLYPYWLMYLGVPQDEFFSYMMRDKLSFEIDKYAYEKELKKMDIEEFIGFCIRNKRYIIRETII